MHDQDFAALLETPDLLRQALDVRDYVTAFRDDVPRRFVDMLTKAMREVEDQMPGWHLLEEPHLRSVSFCAEPALGKLASLQASVGAGLDNPTHYEEIKFLGPYWAVWTRDNIRPSRRARLQEIVSPLIPDLRDEEAGVAAWGRPAGWPMADEADEILAATGDAGLQLARTMARHAVALGKALEAAADKI